MPIQSEADLRVPKYGERPRKPGLYLALLHGREYPKEQMNDWGTDGPVIGPIRWCHTTYATDIKIEFESADDELLYFRDACFPGARHIEIVEDLLTYNGKYYGDWTVFAVNADEAAMPKDSFRPVRRRADMGRRFHG
jgi:hypothetical protein